MNKHSLPVTSLSVIMIRAEVLDEHYYAERNVPLASQITRRTAQFVDEVGRLYMIAEENGRPFQNPRVPPAYTAEHSAECILDSDGNLKLFVRLTGVSRMPWFTWQDLDQPLTLIAIASPTQQHVVILRRHVRSDRKRAVGYIYIDCTGSTLTPDLCHQLLL